MTQPIDRETAIDLVKKANSVKHGPESSSDHTAYLLGIDAVQRLCDLAVAHSRKDAEAVASDSLGQPDNLEVIIDAFIEDYEMIGETEDGRDACHTPTEGERALIKDAICGLLVDTDWDNAWGAHIKSLAHPPEADKLLQQALEVVLDEHLPGFTEDAPRQHDDVIYDKAIEDAADAIRQLIARTYLEKARG